MALRPCVLLALAAEADSDSGRKARAKGLLSAKAAPCTLVARPPSPTMSDELKALRDACGEDVYALGALGRQDRGALKARLRELGYKGMRLRVKLEEELMALPPAKP